jgi:hypothetical protein
MHKCVGLTKIQARTVSPPLLSDASAETLLNEQPKFLLGDLTPIQGRGPDVIWPSDKAPGRQMIHLRSFPDCLERPNTFDAVGSAPVWSETDDETLVRF